MSNLSQATAAAADELETAVGDSKEHNEVAQEVLESDSNGGWVGPNDPDNPYNWRSGQKISVGIVCSASQLVTTMSASMIAPAMDQMLSDLGMNASTGQIAFSVFFLGLGFAPFIVAPLSEIYGRKPIWLGGNAFFIFWNSICMAGFSPVLMIVGRFMAASGASVGITLTAPVLSDMYGADKRGRSMAIAGILPYVGPALGPIVGGLSSQHLWWPWLFWIISLMDAVVLVLGYFLIHETFAPVILKRKKEKSNAIPIVTGMPAVRMAWEDFSVLIGPAVVRPIRLLTCRAVVPFLGLSVGLIFGIYTLMLGTFASLFLARYGHTQTEASLHYIAIALGAFLCAQAGGPIMDAIWRRMKHRHRGRQPTPEYRVPYMVVGFTIGVPGLFWYAWTAETTQHWALVDAGVCLFVCGTFMFSQALFAYLLDEFPGTHTASANAACRLCSYLFGFLFPIFAPKLYSTLGYGWGNTILGLILGGDLVLTMLVLSVWGEKVRAAGRRMEESRSEL